jgi:hypothetical protein
MIYNMLIILYISDTITTFIIEILLAIAKSSEMPILNNIMYELVYNDKYYYIIGLTLWNLVE